MAQRPQPLVRESIVVSGLLLRRQPHAAQLIGRLLRRHRHAGMLVHHLPIGGATAVCNPRARAGAHDRLHGRDQAARGPPQRDAIALADVDVRLAVGQDRKSTRLNSSHGYISYAVFCLKKKKNKQKTYLNKYLSTTITR